MGLFDKLFVVELVYFFLYDKQLFGFNIIKGFFIIMEDKEDKV